ncbi:hypothetical protein DPMN_158740 [Dreissena polymorpha]|uniref:Uncharacterized protein n=1 Tax=Dreissena polymorpha TaxID=45954 RepID=A0A9D4EMW6_DREPO|nr:hypothetical protein DPMN_158740 [Dreissena polymorpha]
MLEAYEIPPSGIPSTVSASYMQTTGLADVSAEAGSESNVEANVCFPVTGTQHISLLHRHGKPLRT